MKEDVQQPEIMRKRKANRALNLNNMKREFMKIDIIEEVSEKKEKKFYKGA